jgi:hypothetical protein
LPAGGAIFAEPIHLGAADHLGRDDHFVTHFARGEPGADDGLGAPLRLGPWRDGIEFRRIEHVDAVFDCAVDLGVAVGLAVLAAEGHGAEAERAHLNAGSAELAMVHMPLQRTAAPIRVLLLTRWPLQVQRVSSALLARVFTYRKG